MLLSIVLAATLSQATPPLRPVATYSIVARDPKTGELGVAVQSHWFSVGTVVTWAEAGVGVVATQSFVDPAYGKLGLELMRAGKSAPETLRGLLATDDARAVRQVAMIDAQGRIATHTGEKCIQGAGHQAGKDFSVQANLMDNDRIWPAMARAFQSAPGDLADRMLAALEAAEAEGGDIRGKQSAAMIVVKARSSGKSWMDRTFDLRIEDHPAPLVELRRLITLQRAYNLMNAGDLAVEKGDAPGALAAYAAAEKLAPDHEEMVFWHAVSLVGLKRTSEALPLFKKVFAKAPRYRTLTPRLVKAGLLPDDPQLLRRILEVR